MLKIISQNFIKKIIEKFIYEYPNIKIRTRFPPEPNGYLHIGHAKSIFLNFSIANQYHGTCNLRFDDTNPKKEKKKYTSKIKKDINWLGYNWHEKEKYSSEYFNFFYICAKKLIKKNLAYVDQLSQKDIKKYRGSLKKPGTNSPFRDRTIKENLFLFKQMKLGKFPEGSICLRAKINMDSPCIIMRDPVLYRIIYTKHHKTGNKWFIYPTYDFSHCLSDMLEGITHSLCTLEFLDNKKLYNWILKKLKFSKNLPKQYEFSKLNLEYTILSKRKIKKLILFKIVNGWSDPRLHTLSGLRNRGYTPRSIKKFCQNIGVTKQISTIELSFLEKCLKDEIDPISPRRMAILDPIKIIIENFPENKTKYIYVPNHPKIKNLGYRKVLFSKEIYIENQDFKENPKKNYKGLVLGKKVRLKYACNIKAINIIKNKKNKISYIICKYYPETFGKTPKYKKKNKIIHWISKKNKISSKFILFQPLFLSKNPEKIKNFIENVNPKSKIKKKGYIEKIIQTEKIKHSYQFERIGFFFQKPKNKKKDQIIFSQILSLKKNKF